MTLYRTFLTTLLFLCMASPAIAAATFTTAWRSVSFDTPTPLSHPVEVGLDAVSVTEPPDVPHGKALLEITLVAISGEMRGSLGNSDSEVLNYVKSTFLGTSRPADKVVQQNFLGRTVNGELLSTKIPAPREIEVYLIPLSGGESVAVAFCRGLSAPREKFEALIETVASTFRESAGKQD